MALATGTRLGPYEILSQIGAGGMGEVYRARDLNLNRDVAVKVLLNLSTDPKRLQRFEQEARAAGAINHPNILAVYHMGTYEGAPYLVSELLEGETLRQVLRKGPLPLRKVIDYGVQIANGLQAAHEKGIVHRDLKPENVFLTRDGRIKILDFGLAKLTQPDSTEAGGLTMTSATEPGVVMGTVGYMSPEQVRGDPVDQRTDIFAFGAMLYEMLAGKPAFQQATATESMTAILREDPPNILDLVPVLPLGIQRVLQRCIEKGPDQRFHSAADLAFALGSAADSPPSGPRPAMAGGSRGNKKVWLIPIGALVLAVPVALFFLWPKIHKKIFVEQPKPEIVKQTPVVEPPPDPNANVNRPPAGPRELTIEDPATYTWFNSGTRQAVVWYSTAPSGNLRYFDGPGVDPQSGKDLTPVTPEFVANLLKPPPPPVPAPAPAQKPKPQVVATPKTKESARNDAASRQVREDAGLDAVAQEAQVALNNENYQEALDICGKVLSASPGSQPCTAVRQHAAIKLAEKLVNEAAAFWEKGDFDHALRSAQKALDLDPANKNAARLKGLALRMKPGPR
jgi:serine/threonine protein kinase